MPAVDLLLEVHHSGTIASALLQRELVRNVGTSDCSPDLLNQNLHFNKVIYVHIKV